MQWRQITLVGVGLLGGSLALAIRRGQLAQSLVGYVRRPESVKDCQRLNAFDRVELHLERAVAGADLVVLCTPVGQMGPLIEQMSPVLGPDMLITDVGSVKGTVVAQLEMLVHRTGARFMGSHPMAGSEQTGLEAARVGLFKGATCAITPTPHSTPGDVERLVHFWQQVGGRPLVLAPELHDELVSRCSHLPHVAAAALVNLVLHQSHPPEQVDLCGPGFRDATRVASGSPEMWRDICQANRSELIRQLDELVSELGRFRQALAENRAAEVEAYLREAKLRRDQWIKRSQADPGTS